MKTIVLTGGGTAGHITPNIALLPTLEKLFDKIVYIGSGNEIEKKLLLKHTSVKYFSIPTARLVRKLSLKNLLIPFKLFKAKNAALKLLKELQPSVIFNKGGYVGLPVVLAGAKLNIPIIAHESDLTLGLAHKLVKNKYRYICTTFKTTASKLKNGVYTGTPISTNIKKGNADNLKQQLKLNSKPVLLVLGGSQGSKQINTLVDNNLKYLTKNHQIIHIRGKGNLNKIKQKDYHQLEFCNNMGDLYAATDLCITRGGSNTIHELLYNHIPMLIIPLQHNSRGDQLDNAKYFEKQNLALSLCKKEIDNQTFLTAFDNLVKQSNKIKSAQKVFKNNNALEKITKLILDVSNKKTG